MAIWALHCLPDSSQILLRWRESAKHPGINNYDDLLSIRPSLRVPFCECVLSYTCQNLHLYGGFMFLWRHTRAMQAPIKIQPAMTELMPKTLTSNTANTQTTPRNSNSKTSPNHQNLEKRVDQERIILIIVQPSIKADHSDSIMHVCHSNSSKLWWNYSH